MKKIIIPLALALVLAAGLAIGYVFGLKGKTPALPAAVCANETAAQVKEKLLNAGVISEYANSFSGLVSSVSGREVKFETLLVNPLQDESLKSRIAVITDKTKIYVLTLRSQEERDKAAKDSATKIEKLQTDLSALQAEAKACSARSGSSTDCSEAVKNQPAIQANISQLQSLSAASVRTEGTIFDIKPGQLITVSAGKGEDITKSGANIANEPKFEAAAVEVRDVPKK